MKKLICLFLVVCSLLSCLSACGENAQPEEEMHRFESEEAMMSQLSGIWLVATKAENQEYYIFQDGKLFYSDDATFLSKMTACLDAIQANEGDEALLNTTFEGIITSMMKNNLLGEPLKIDSVDFKTGIILCNTAFEGNTCKKISVGENSVTVVDREDLTFTLTQLVSDCTFKHEHFESLFAAAKKPYQDKIEEKLKKEQLHAKKLYGVLDYSKVWKAAIPGYEDNYVHFGFTKDGKCYFILSIGYDIYSGGKGTYSLNDDDTITMSMKTDGKTYTDTYTFDSAKKTLKLKKKGYFGKAGTKFKLKKDSDVSFSKLKTWGKEFA